MSTLEKEIYTYEDYATWPEGARVELIDGVAYKMSATPNRLPLTIALEKIFAV